MNDPAVRNGGEIIIGRYDDFDARRLAREILYQGEAYARAKKRADYLKHMHQPMIAQMIIGLRETEPKMSDAKLRLMVMASEEYRQYIEDMTQSAERANLHKARKEAAQALFDGMRSEEVTRRSALYGRS